ncbi:MAG: hypothetical protein HY965_07065 [Ignavibacteriales bacterium]|nr:hypothetical protein [Ignavibacteriales bacterium]
MKKAIPVFFVFLIASLFSGCNRGESPLGPEELKLEGTWSEDFDFYYSLIYMGSYFPPGGIPETAELIFSGGRFTLKFPQHDASSEKDPMAVEQTGSYRIDNGVLILLLDGNSNERKFSIKFNVNAITISTFSYVKEDGSVSVALSSFLWGNSFHKTSGEFIRKDVE